MKRFFITLLVLQLPVIFTANAQPSPNELADKMHELNQQRLSNIQSLEYTVKTSVAGFETQSISRYIKKEMDGRLVLVPDEDFDDAEREMLEGLYDGSFDRIIRAAESVSNDQIDGQDVYRLVIRDKELLNSLGAEEMDDDIEIEKATLWVEGNDLFPVRMLYEQFEDGSGLKVELLMDDYTEYSGLPIAKKMSMNIEGLDQMMSDEDIAEARQALVEFEEQLQSMPEAQRDMIRNQLSGQMEQFEQMIESGMASSTVIEIADVKVNP